MITDCKSILAEIQKRQVKTFCRLQDFLSQDHRDRLPAHHRGMYWIWSDLTLDEMQKMKAKKDTKEVPISDIVSQRHGLTNINKITKEGFTIVYNGVGGYVNSPKGFGLRERIRQEASENDPRTGTLNLRNRRLSRIENWAVSFFDFDATDNQDIAKKLAYPEDAKILEINWRLEFGWPILNRH